MDKELSAWRKHHATKLALDERMKAVGLPVWDHSDRIWEQMSFGPMAGRKLCKGFTPYCAWKTSVRPGLLKDNKDQKDQKHAEYVKVGVNPHKWTATVVWQGQTKINKWKCELCGLATIDSTTLNENTCAGDRPSVLVGNTDDLQELYDKVCAEFEAARNALRAGMHNKPLMIRLVHSFYINTTVTSGVTNGVSLTAASGTTTSLPLTPYNTSDWSAISALFDEYKVINGNCVFNYHNPTAGTNGGTNLDPNGLPVIAYDPTDAPAPTSSRDCSVIAQHKYLNNLISDTSPSGPVVPACGGHHEFSWKPPHGAYIDPITDAAAGIWTPVAYANTINTGYLKFYHVGKQTANLATGAGHVHMNVEMRCRT